MNFISRLGLWVENIDPVLAHCTEKYGECVKLHGLESETTELWRKRIAQMQKMKAALHLVADSLKKDCENLDMSGLANINAMMDEADDIVTDLAVATEKEPKRNEA